MIQLNDIHLQLGTKVLLEDANLRIYPKQKWGLIGQNGSGKTSVFKLFLGEVHEDKGNISIPKDWQLAHMGQEVHAAERSALDYILDGDDQLRQLQHKLENTEDGEVLAKLYTELESIDGYTAESRAHQLLSGLGFEPGDGDKDVKAFSGGWRIRLNLAQALMCRSDFLLLDEPTNHLDLDACFWLENWLKHYQGTLLIVSHDRDFLDNVVENIVSIENTTLASYTGNYTAHEVQKAERLAQQEVVFKKQQARVAEIEDFVRRFRAKATKAKQAQSRLKELERMERIAPAHIDSPFQFQFPCAEKQSQVLLSISEASIGYAPNSPLVNNVEFSIHAQSRIGLLGRNGAGKSTLMKSLAGALPLLAGERNDGTHLSIAYFAQHQLEALDLTASCALHLQRITPKASEQEVRNFLGGFDFRGDRVFETIEHFSGGEKARLALAILAWQKPNLLLLDEPTNHLDLEMCHALTLALQNFEGAIVIVSHDRHLLKNTVDQFYLVDDHRVTEFDGDLKDYQRWLSDKQKNANQETATIDTPSEASNAGSDKLSAKEKRQAAANARNKLKPLANAIKKLDKEIEALNGKLKVIEHKLADDSLYSGENKELESLLKEQNELRTSLSKKEETWLCTSEEIEALKP
ncbi:MAG: ATP-binding cassette domain-containing protein [Agarilytica sp.]